MIIKTNTPELDKLWYAYIILIKDEFLFLNNWDFTLIDKNEYPLIRMFLEGYLILSTS